MRVDGSANPTMPKKTQVPAQYRVEQRKKASASRARAADKGRTESDPATIDYRRKKFTTKLVRGKKLKCETESHAGQE